MTDPVRSSFERTALRLVPDVSAPFRRLPIAIALLCVLFTISLVVTPGILPFADRHIATPLHLKYDLFLIDGVFAGVLLAIAAALLVERRGGTFRQSLAWTAMALLALVALGAATNEMSPWVGLEPEITAWGAGFLALAAIGGNGAGQKANARIVRAVAAIPLAYVMAYGIARFPEIGAAPQGNAALWFSTDKLSPFGKVLLMCLWILFWMLLLPKRKPPTSPAAADLPPKDSVTAVLADRLLVPALLLFVAATLALVLTEFNQALRQGPQFLRYDAPLELGISILGVFAVLFLLIHPVQGLASAFTRAVFRRWWWVGLFPIGLMAVGVAMILNPFVDVRVRFHGAADSEYWRATLGIGLLLAVGIAAFAPRRRDLRTLCASLGVVLLLSSFGPWSQRAFSIWYARNEMQSALVSAGVLVDGRIGPRRIDLSKQCLLVASSPRGLTSPCWHHVAGGMLSLIDRGGLATIAHWYEATPGGNLDDSRRLAVFNTREFGIALLGLIGIGKEDLASIGQGGRVPPLVTAPPPRQPPPPPPPPPVTWRNFQLRGPMPSGLLDIAGFDHLIPIAIGGAERTSRDGPLSGVRRDRHALGSSFLVTSLEAGHLVVKHEGLDAEVRFPLDEVIARAQPLQQGRGPVLSVVPGHFEASSGRLRVRLHLNSLSGHREIDGDWIRAITGGSATLLIAGQAQR